MRKIPLTPDREHHDVIIYLRCSTLEQNPKLQLQDCESINTFPDYILFQDSGSAWKDTNRPEFERLVKLIKRGKVRNLICWDLDRLHRNRKKLIEFFQFCKLYRCRIHSFRQQWLNELNEVPQPWGEIVHDMMLNVMGWLGEDESRKKSERVKLAVRKKEGKPTKSYKGHKWGRKTISTFKQNRIIKLSAEGMSMREIGNELGIASSTVHKFISSQRLDKK